MTRPQESQLSIHRPSDFLRKHWKNLLPSWQQPIGSVLIYLQFSPIQLCDRTPQTEEMKDQLRLTFLSRAHHWHHQITHQGHLAEPFDPKYGTPIFSEAGSWPLDDVAVAHALLKFPILEQGGCKLLRHPHWNSAVFPSTLLSSASPDFLRQLIHAHDIQTPKD